MTEKRFIETISTGIVTDNVTKKKYNCEMRIDDDLLKLFNDLHGENKQLQQRNKRLEEKIQRERISFTKTQERWSKEAENKIKELSEENEQLKQDNNALIHLLENQSMIIQELHSKLLEYQVKEPIVLIKKDLELMNKAISYYTHGRCGE